MSVNLSAMQARIQGACATGMVVQSVGRDGSLVCVADANAGGDVTGVATGWGMVGGGVSGELTLAANRSEVQQRVSGMCPVGTFVRAVGLNGSVFCSEATEAQTRVAGVCPEGQSVQRVLANGNVACIDIGITATAAFSLTTGFGLTSVGGSGSLNFGVNTSAIQARIVDACAVGSFIRSIGREGELVCGVANSGDVTAVQTAGGLVGGGVSGDLTLAANTSFLQRRVHEACAAGSSMRAVHMNGSIDCEDDAGVRQVNTGTGLSGGSGGVDGTGALTLSIDSTAVQQRVAATCAAGSSIREIKEDGGVVCQADNDSGGDVTRVIAGAGITGGGTSGDVTVSADLAAVQARVAATCAAGSSIRAISASGAVTCQTDNNAGGDVTSVVAALGLLGGATSGEATLNADVTYLQRRVAACATGSSIRAIAEDGSVTCHTDNDSGGDVTGVVVGAGLQGGGASGEVTIAVNSTLLAQVEDHGATLTAVLSTQGSQGSQLGALHTAITNLSVPNAATVDWPMCSSTTRGQMRLRPLDDGRSDELVVCSRMAGRNGYQWRTVMPTLCGDALSSTACDAGGYWARSVGGSTAADIASSNALAIGTTVSDGLFVAGAFKGTVKFGDITLTSSGGYDTFVAKYADANGNVEWAVRLGGTGEVWAHAIDVSHSPDADGVMVAGRFAGTATVGDVTLANSGGHDMFVARLSATDGSTVWAKKFGGSGDDVLHGIAVGASASSGVFVTGKIASPSVVMSPSLTLTNAGAPLPQGLVARLAHADGAVVWGKVYLRSSTPGPAEYSTNTAIAVGSNPGDGIFVAGYFNSKVQVKASNAATLECASFAQCGFVVKHGAADGTGEYARQIDAGSAKRVWVNAIAVDAAPSANGVFIAGQFTGKAIFEAETGPATEVDSAGSDDIFVAKLAKSQLYCAWAKRFGSTGDDYAYGIAVGQTATSSGVVVTGAFQGELAWGSGNAAAIGGTGGVTGSFYGLLDAATGAPFWVTDAGDASFPDNGQLYFTGRGVAVDTVGGGGSGAVYAAKHFAQNVTLAGTTLYESGGSVGAFVAKVKRDGSR